MSHTWFEFEKAFKTYCAWVDMLVRTDIIMDDTAQRLRHCFCDVLIFQTTRLTEHSQAPSFRTILESWCGLHRLPYLNSLDRLVYALICISPKHPQPEPLAKHLSEANKHILKRHVFRLLYYNFTRIPVYNNACEIFCFMCGVYHSFSMRTLAITNVTEDLREEISILWKHEYAYLLNAMRWRFHMLRDLSDEHNTDNHISNGTCRSDFAQFVFGI